VPGCEKVFDLLMIFYHLSSELLRLVERFKATYFDDVVAIQFCVFDYAHSSLINIEVKRIQKIVTHASPHIVLATAPAKKRRGGSKPDLTGPQPATTSLAM
jgi:hypothetical protein